MSSEYIHDLVPELRSILRESASRIQAVYPLIALETLQRATPQEQEARYRTGHAYAATGILRICWDEMPEHFRSRYGFTVSRLACAV